MVLVNIVYNKYTIKYCILLGEEYLENFNYRKWSRAVTLKDYRSELEVGNG